MHYAAALLYGWAASVVVAIALGFYNRGLDQNSAVVALCAGALISLAGCVHARRARIPAAPPRGWEWFPILLFALFAARAFLWLIFRDQDDLRVLSPNNLGDMSLHLTYIEHLANGTAFWPDNPIFASGKLAYAMGVDLFNSLLLLAGLDVVRGLIWVGLAGAALAGMALWQWGRGFGLLGFLCAGGLLGFAAFFQPAGEPFFQDYPGLLSFDWAWKNPALALLVTQRGFLFALPAGLLLLASWRTRFLHDGDGWRLPLVGEVLLYAAMPVFHLHTFLALSFVLACWFVCRSARRKQIAIVVAAAVAPATILVYLTTGMFQANAAPGWEDMGQVENPPKRPPAEVLGWQPGWMANEPLEKFDPWMELAEAFPKIEVWESHGRFLLFWLGNFGVLPLFAAAAAWLSLARLRGAKLPWWWAVAGATAFILVTPFLQMSQPYQSRSVHGWLLGENVSDLTANAAVFGAAGGCLIGWVYLRRMQGRARFLRGSLLAVASLLLLDGLFASAHQFAPSFPLLPANAIPLLAATGGFFLLLQTIARRWNADVWLAALIFPALYLFFLCCNVKFAPSAWDNTKLMLWAYLLVLPPILELVIGRWHWALRGVALVALFFSGFVTLLGGINSQHQGYSIAKLSDLDAVREATAQIPVSETFAAEPTYNHPLLLIGRKLVLGYIGHVSSHGLLFAEQERHLDALMNGGRNWRLHAARLDTRYLYFGPGESARWPDSLQGWRDGASVVAEGNEWTLFDLETPPVPVVE